jgi:hypothetical protein
MPTKKRTKTEPTAAGYRDIFGIRDAGKQPLVLRDCTSIEWPAGWSQKDADRWRKANKLERLP